MAKKTTKTDIAALAVADAVCQGLEALEFMTPKPTVEEWVAKVTGTTKLPEGSFEVFRNQKERGVTIRREVFVTSPREMMARMDLLKKWANARFGHEKVRVTRNGWLIFPV